MLYAFDLDDTLYKEADYVVSGYRCVAASISEECEMPADDIAAFLLAHRPRGFEDAIAKYGIKRLSVADMDEIYRAHVPDIQLVEGAHRLLEALKAAGHTLVLITDGSSRRQRAKIAALGIEGFFDDIIISGETGADKTTPVPWQRAERLLTEADDATEWHSGQYRRCIYIGDNPTKDFHMARRRGWHTIMLRDTTGLNTHPQNLEHLPAEYHPNAVIFGFGNVGQNL